MKTYYVNEHVQESRSFFEKLTSPFSHAVTEDSVNKHLTLLIGQAVFLVLLAIVFIGYEARIQRIEASVVVPESRITRSELLTDASSNNVLGEDVEFTVGFDEEDMSEYEAEKNVIELPEDAYTIALFGDSMVDTMEGGTYLRKALAEKYPGTQFVIFNYGKGAITASDGLETFYDAFEHRGRSYKPVDELEPDVIIVGSYAYNVYSPPDVNKHWLEYTRLVQEAQKITPNVYMLAEIAPQRSGFGLGAEGVIWEPHNAWTHTQHIIDQLYNPIGLSEALGVPVIDTFNPSLKEDKIEGRRELIDTSDNIHPSEKGHEFMAKIIAETLDFENLR